MNTQTTVQNRYQMVDGGVCAPTGFAAYGVYAGFRKDDGRGDLALVACEHVASAAGVFTQNRFCAAPVALDRRYLAATSGRAAAVVVNAGIANAATGAPGLAAASATSRALAALLGCDEQEVLVASTGVIGKHLPMAVMERALPALVDGLGRDPEENDLAAARAITTTDTHPKRAAVTYADPCGATYTVGGMCKGSGMISPNMATMIAVLTTDAPVCPEALDRALRDAVDASFNRVTVDSDTSTNDTCIVLASGDAGGDEIATGGERFELFAGALLAVASDLAQQIAADGEGATKLVRVEVRGAADDADAEVAARTVANSPLVKTAIAGHDANWGRIAAALGRSGATFDQHRVDIDILGMAVCRGGLVVDFDEQEALRRFEEPTVEIVCDLGAGTSSACVWTCDLTHEYISINADYRS